MDKTFRILLTLFVIVGALLIGIVIVAIGNTNRAIRAAAWVNHTHAYINEIDATLGSLREAESAVNAFLLNGDPANSSHYGRAFAELAEHLTVAQALAAADPVEAKAVAELDAMLRYRAERARTLIAAHRANDPATVEATLAGDTDEINFVTIEQAARNIRLRQTQLLNERDQTAFQQDQLARVTLYLGALFSVLILVAASWFIRDNLNARRQAHQLLAESNEQLEIKVQARTADLESVNKKLRAENIESRWSNQALEHQLRYDGLIINSLSEPILVVTKALKVSRINPATLRATHRTSVQLVDHPIESFIKLAPPIDASSPRSNPLVDALEFGFDLRDCVGSLVVDGSPDRPIRLNLFPLRDRDRVVGGVMTLYLDHSPST